MDELLMLQALEIRIFDYKSYAAVASRREIIRGQEQRIAVSPKVQIEIFADNDNLLKANDILDRYRDKDGPSPDVCYLSEAQLI